MKYLRFVCILASTLFLTITAVAQQVKVEPDHPAAEDADRLAELAAKAKKVVDMYSDHAVAYVPGGKYVVFTSNRSGLSQLYRTSLDKPNEPPLRLTNSNDRLMGEVIPLADGKSVIYLQDEGANELWSIYSISIDGGEPVMLSESGLQSDVPRFAAKRPDMIYYSSKNIQAGNAALYSRPLSGGEARKIYEENGYCRILDVSDDGRWVLWSNLQSFSSAKLSLIDTETGTAKVIYPAEGRTAIFFFAGFVPGTNEIVLPTDDGGEQTVFLKLDLNGNIVSRYVETNPMITRCLGFVMSPDGKTLAVNLNVGDHDIIRVFELASMKVLTDIELPLGTGAPYSFSPDGKRLLGFWSTPSSPEGIYKMDIKSGKATLLLDEKRPGLDELPEVTTESVTVESKDGLRLPVLVHRPVANKGKLPVIVFFHGGPSATATAQWNPRIRFFTSLGYAYVEPNIRGSSGFGRAYESADDYLNRPKVFDDMRAVAEWVGKQPWADANRLIVAGGSYGGFMSLNGITRQSDLWAAGIDMYGPADLRTLLRTTSGPARKTVEGEFGQTGKDDDFLASVSAITQVDNIADPLFVYAGANDPRVPKSESDMIVAAARKKGVPVEYMVAENEGHSLLRTENQIEFYSRVALFLDRYVIKKK